MRAPFKGNDYFCSQLNTVTQKIEQTYLESIGSVIASHKANVMLGDGTITQAETFDPQRVQIFYQKIANLSKGWNFSGLSRSATEDLHRLYCQFSKEIGKFYVQMYFGIQYHVLPYYRVDKRVIEIQKELAKIADDATIVFKNMTETADKALAAELEKQGYANMNFEELFTKMFEDEKLAGQLDEKVTSIENRFPEFKEMGDRKNVLFSELNDLLIELYQTSSVLVDYNRLMQGEEGATTYIDIEVVKNKKTKAREAFLDTPKMNKKVTNDLVSELESMLIALKKASIAS